MLIRSKTAPCILDDLLAYDPCVDERPNARSCSHVYNTKYERSVIPDLDEVADTGTKWYAVCVCLHCRCRLELLLDFRSATRPCPNHEWPLHHFAKADIENNYTNFECTAPECKALLSARVLTPVLSEREVRYLTDPIEIRARYDKVLQTERTLEEPTVARCLSHFRRYVADALQNDTDKKIPAHNKNFMVVLGEGARNLLQRIGFRYALVEPGIGAWYLPQNLQQAKNRSEWYQLEDLREELSMLIRERPEDERRELGESYFSAPPQSAKNLERILGMQDYDRAIVARRPPPLPQEISHAYIGLGTKPDFSDELISFAFDRQVLQDPQNTSVYFGYLKNVAKFRHSEALETKTLTLVSEGYYSAMDLSNAYKALNIEFKHVQAGVITDDLILSQYRARLSDVGPDEQRRMKESLGIIARDRQSQKLMNVISLELNTYEQALEYLGADAETPDDSIDVLLTVKHNENKAERQEDLAIKAAEIIAEHRNSDVLRRIIRRHQLQESSSMDVSSAYSILGIGDASVDDEQVSEAWQLSRLDNAHDTETYDQALSSIAQQRNSTRLFEQLRAVEEQVRSQPKPTRLEIGEPRGLKNIGNTCYLNSLLQYFFTIKPVRDLVHNFNEHAEDAQNESLSSKRVADMSVKKEQVERAQNFVAELDKLFEKMITTRSQYTSPEKELARLTLVNVVNEAVQKNVRRSTITGSRPLEVDLAPTGEPSMNMTNGSVSNVQSQTDMTMTDVSDGLSSEATTLNGDQLIEKETEEPILVEPENEQRTPESTITREPSELLDTESTGVDQKIDQKTKVPPELPPRPSRPEASKDEYEAYAQQQDVREVIENVLYQLRWAMKGDMTPSKADQVDLISRLFFGRENTITEEDGKKPETKSTPFYEMNLILSKPTDIYTALDESLGRSDVEKTGQYQFRTIEALPDVLQFSVNRIVFSKEEAKAVRVNHQLKLKKNICMDRYMSRNERMLNLRREQWVYLKQLKMLKDKETALTDTSTQTTIPETLSLVQDYLRDLSSDAAEVDFDAALVNAELMDGLAEVAADARKETADVTSRIKGLETELHHLFDEDDTCINEYSLHSVFVHRGGATSGHWVIFINDPETNCWRQFNDEEVTQVDEQAVLEPDSVNVGSSFIVYIRKEKLREIVEAVKREPEEMPELSSESCLGYGSRYLRVGDIWTRTVTFHDPSKSKKKASLPPSYELIDSDNYELGPNWDLFDELELCSVSSASISPKKRAFSTASTSSETPPETKKKHFDA